MGKKNTGETERQIPVNRGLALSGPGEHLESEKLRRQTALRLSEARNWILSLVRTKILVSRSLRL